MSQNSTYANSLIAIFNDRVTAEHARDELLRFGVRRDQIEMSTTDDIAYDASAGNTGLTGRHQDSSGGGIAAFFHRIFGSEPTEEDRTYYSEATREGRCAVVVHANDEVLDQASDILNRNGAVEVGTEAERGTAGEPTTARGEIARDIRESGERAEIPVVNEELRVGKRTVRRGGVRIVSRVSEQPVQESIPLREEHVRVERRPVDRPATERDLAAANRGVIEVTETAEEPIVEKRARVVEEVVVSKEQTERTADIRDTVRRTDVQAEELRGDTARSTGADYDADFRRDFRTRYGESGRYEDYAPAYNYGYQMASDPRYQQRSFDEVEPELRSDYTRRNPNSTWERMKDSVRYGWEKVTGRH